jgi:hypothetical protein
MNPAGCCNFFYQWANDDGSNYKWFSMNTPGGSRAYTQKNGNWKILIQYVYSFLFLLKDIDRPFQLRGKNMLIRSVMINWSVSNF